LAIVSGVFKKKLGALISLSNASRVKVRVKTEKYNKQNRALRQVKPVFIVTEFATVNVAISVTLQV